MRSVPSSVRPSVWMSHVICVCRRAVQLPSVRPCVPPSVRHLSVRPSGCRLWCVSVGRPSSCSPSVRMSPVMCVCRMAVQLPSVRPCVPPSVRHLSVRPSGCRLWCVSVGRPSSCSPSVRMSPVMCVCRMAVQLPSVRPCVPPSVRRLCPPVRMSSMVCVCRTAVQLLSVRPDVACDVCVGW